jgi:hypothetical protein
MLLSKDISKAEMSKVLQTPQPQPNKPLPPPPPRLPLSVNLKLEVTKQAPERRADALEAAYAIEEMI